MIFLTLKPSDLITTLTYFIMDNFVIVFFFILAKEKSSEKEMWKALAQAEAKFWSKQKKLKQKQKIACLPKAVQLKNLLSKIKSQEM